MNRLIPVFALLVLMLSAGVRADAQATSLTATSAPSVCFNTGLLVVQASGGTAPYTYSIISGPYYPNINYPIVLAAHQDTFFDMPQGTFTVEVTDAGGNTAFFSETVGGTYQFPVMNFYTTTYGVRCVGSFGLAPYHYALSSTGSNSGFGPYRSADTFTLCPGTYWIRLMDSCGNIYTDSFHFQYINSFYAQVVCVNFAGGNLILSASGGRPPYTYWANGISNHTGLFHGLPFYYSASVSDSCGEVYNLNLYDPEIALDETCPFDSSYTVNLPYPDTLTFTCTNCTPYQSGTFAYPYIGPVFSHIVPYTPYNFIITEPKGSCGVDTLPYYIQPPLVSEMVTYLSCHSFIASVGFSVPVDSYAVYDINHIRIASSISGYFYNMPSTASYVKAYVDSACAQDPVANLTIPYFDTACYTPLMDSSCQMGWLLNVYPPIPEIYYLTDLLGDTVRTGSADSFYYLPPFAPYVLLSDSGCQINIQTPVTNFQIQALPGLAGCIAGAYQIAFAEKGSGCQQYYLFLHLYHNQVQVYDGILPLDYLQTGYMSVVDTGWYSYDLYLWGGALQPYATYDTTCPISAGTVFVSGANYPYPDPDYAYVCYPNTNDSVYYTIYGGTAPYTVEIVGYGYTTLNGNTGVFPTNRIGVYTMIVYDNCGISRSKSFNIIDTCHCNAYASIGTDPYTNICAGTRVELQSSQVPATGYEWFVNGQLYGNTPDTAFVPPSGGLYMLEFLVNAYPGCADSSYYYLAVDSAPPRPFLGDDTTYCGPFDVELSTGYYNYNNNSTWSTGTTGPFLNVTSPGYYSVNVYNMCGSVTSGINISQILTPDFGNDTTYCGAFSRTLYTNDASTVWSTGAVGPSITVSAPGTYYASYTNLCGTFDDSIHLLTLPAAYNSDTAFCDVFTRVLDAMDSTSVWSTGATGRMISVSAPGLYLASFTDQCGTFTDSFLIVLNTVTGLNIYAGRRTLNVCEQVPDSIALVATVDSFSGVPVTFVWSTGQTNPLVFGATLMADTEGVYQVTATRGQCFATAGPDTIDAVYCDTPCVYATAIPDAFTPNGDNKNDEYKILYSCAIESFSMTILDRWGQTMYQSTDINKGWDGTFKGQQQPEGSYIWFICVQETEKSKNICQMGTLNLMR